MRLIWSHHNAGEADAGVSDVRFESKADIRSGLPNVRLTPPKQTYAANLELLYTEVPGPVGSSARGTPVMN